ncbi:MAG: ureidoglycolate lyase [Nitrososphaeria archaeon]|jgi:ureidoglycolate lyase
MEYVEVKAKLLTDKGFSPFGTIISLPKIKPSASTPALDYWDEVVHLPIEERAASFLLCKRKPFEFTSMERHVKTSEIFIPLEGYSIFPFAPPNRLGDPKAKPEMNKLEAFIFDGTKAIMMHKGTWHVPPIPLTEQATFLIISRKNTAKKDIFNSDLENKVRISL